MSSFLKKASKKVSKVVSGGSKHKRKASSEPSTTPSITNYEDDFNTDDVLEFGAQLEAELDVGATTPLNANKSRQSSAASGSGARRVTQDTGKLNKLMLMFNWSVVDVW